MYRDDCSAPFSQKGISLAEVLVAAVVFAVMMIVILGLVVTMSKNERTIDRLNAITIAEEYLETGVPYCDLDSSLVFDKMNYRLIVEVTKRNDLEDINVRVLRCLTGDTIAHYYTAHFGLEADVD